ncbi:uncharacterized protein LOC129807937 isoform X2 [Phlebotomus papatasi]|nr:uncharacterized protein LOC129807937 isoform X2 [Phlebotomus papatasi]
MENASTQLHSGYSFGSQMIEDNRDVVEIGGEIASTGEERVQTVDFNQTTISKLLDAADKLAKIQQTQKRIADILDLVQDEEEDNLEGTVTFPLKTLREFQNLERMSNNDAYRKNLTKSLRMLLNNGSIQDPIKNLLDDSIVMYFSWDDPKTPTVVSLKQTICFGHVIYNALGLGFPDYANFVQSCLSVAQQRFQSNNMNEVHMTRTEPQLHQFSFISDIAQKISDIEIFQRKIESYTGFKKHEIDPMVYLPIASVESLDSLEKVLQYKAIQDVVIPFCKERFEIDKSFQGIVSDSFLAQYSINGEKKRYDLFKYKFFNHSLYVALGMPRLDYEIEVTHQIDSASERLFGKVAEAVRENPPNMDDETFERANKIVKHRKIVLMRKEDLTEQGIPRKFREILRNYACHKSSRATVFKDSSNYISFSKVDEKESTNVMDDVEEKVSRYFPLKSKKALRLLHIKLTDDHFQFTLQQTLDAFYHNRKFSIKDIVSDEFLSNVNEVDLFSTFLMKEFLPVILTLPPKSFTQMAKMEFRALKSAFELKKITQNEVIQLKIELGQTVNIAKNTNGTIKKYLPIATIAEFDDVERNLEYSDFYNEMSNLCKTLLMKQKKFKLTDYVAEELLIKYSARGSANTLPLMETKLFGDILRKFSKRSETDFTSLLQKHHSIVVSKLKNSHLSFSESSQGSQEVSSLEKNPDERRKKRRRQFIEVILPLENQEQLALVNENLQEVGFKTEIEKVFRSLLQSTEQKTPQEIPLEDILEDDLISKLTWNDNEVTSLKNYSLFVDVLYNLMKVDWEEFDKMIQRAFARSITRCKVLEGRYDFAIIPPQKKQRKIESSSKTTSVPPVKEETPLPSTSLEESMEPEDLEPGEIPRPIPSEDEDSQDIVYETDEESSSVKGFEQILPIKSKEEFIQMENLLTNKHFATYFINHFTELKQQIGNEVFGQMFSSELINNPNLFELENLPKSQFYKEVIQVVWKDLRKCQVINAIRDSLETPDGFFKRILPVNEMNLGWFEQRLKRKEFVDCLIKICQCFVETHSDGYFHKLIDSDLIQQYSFNGDDGLRSIEKSSLFNNVLREVYKKSEKELYTKVQMELYLAQALADYKSDKLQS